MPRFEIDSRGTPREVTDRYRINSQGQLFEQMGRYRINPDTLTIETIWERIVGFIFTSNGRPLMTKSGRMIMTKSK